MQSFGLSTHESSDFRLEMAYRLTSNRRELPVVAPTTASTKLPSGSLVFSKISSQMNVSLDRDAEIITIRRNDNLDLVVEAHRNNLSLTIQSINQTTVRASRESSIWGFIIGLEMSQNL